NLLISLKQYNITNDNNEITKLLSRFDKSDFSSKGMRTHIIIQLSWDNNFKKELNNLINNINKKEFIDIIIENSFETDIGAMLTTCDTCKKIVVSYNLFCVYCGNECYGKDKNNILLTLE